MGEIIHLLGKICKADTLCSLLHISPTFRGTMFTKICTQKLSGNLYVESPCAAIQLLTKPRMYNTAPEAKPGGTEPHLLQVPRCFPAPLDDLEQKFFFSWQPNSGCRIGNTDTAGSKVMC